MPSPPASPPSNSPTNVATPSPTTDETLPGLPAPRIIDLGHAYPVRPQRAHCQFPYVTEVENAVADVLFVGFGVSPHLKMTGTMPNSFIHFTYTASDNPDRDTPDPTVRQLVRAARSVTQ
eukprot:227870-Pyramimonas_sp.AAC.1